MDQRLPTVRAAYRQMLPITTRFMDNDVFGHVNNVNYYSFFDTAVCHILVQRGVLSWPNAGHFVVVAESGCRYWTEIVFPDAVTAGVRISRLGTASVRYKIGVFRGEGDVASAEGFLVHVSMDAATRRPAQLPAAWRQALTPLLMES